MKYIITLLTIVSILAACSSDPSSNYKPLNLMEHGVPLTIMAPDSAEVKTMDLLVQKDITVKGKDGDYSLQIFTSTATTTDQNKIASELKTQEAKSPIFSKIISEEDNGFIYENKIDDNTNSYGFKLVKVIGDNEYIFQNDLAKILTQKQAEAMYKVAKETK